MFDANGKKLKQTVTQGGTTEVWLYQDGIEYRTMSGSRSITKTAAWCMMSRCLWAPARMKSPTQNGF